MPRVFRCDSVTLIFTGTLENARNVPANTPKRDRRIHASCWSSRRLTCLADVEETGILAKISAHGIRMLADAKEDDQ